MVFVAAVNYKFVCYEFIAVSLSPLRFTCNFSWKANSNLASGSAQVFRNGWRDNILKLRRCNSLGAGCIKAGSLFVNNNGNITWGSPLKCVCRYILMSVFCFPAATKDKAILNSVLLLGLCCLLCISWTSRVTHSPFWWNTDDLAFVEILCEFGKLDDFVTSVFL